MKVDIITYFSQNVGSILGWALVLFMLIRLIIGFQTYSSAMKQLKQGVGSILFLVVAAVYLISPVDILPDIIPIIGWIDDMAITVGSVYYAQIALNKVFWGEYPPRNRFSAFLIWYGASIVFTYIIKYTIYIS
ncbi:MAG: DUF1232 domain-containing protein [Saprospiraceae bacterium]|nr:DUF1232 domain-containing protein [Saprospiraceae bacterium]